MNSVNSGLKGHALLGKIAFSTLPDWEKNLFGEEVLHGKSGHPLIPENFSTAADKAGTMCTILDWVYYDEFRPYAVMDDGRWIPHSPPDANGQSCAGSGQPKSNLVLQEMLEWLLSRMLESARAKNWEETLRDGGALGHFLQEPFTPGHAVSNDLFHEFFPDPDPERHIRLHHKFDAATGEFKPIPPVLMGTTVPEAAFRLQIEINRGIKEGLKLLRRLIESAYAGEPQENRQKILAGQCRDAAFAAASAWHTVFSIAFNKFEKNEIERLNRLNLTELTPYFVHHCQYVDLVPGCLVKKGLKIPIHISGKNGEERVQNGFGMGGHMGMKFFVNGDVFPRFRCRAGLPSRHTEGQTENTDTTFFVETDTGENLVYSEDMEYKAKRVVSMPLKPGEPAKEIDVSIKGARSLILTAQTRPCISEDGRVKFNIPHVAVCEPELSKEP